jgi:hypothetical protein
VATIGSRLKHAWNAFVTQDVQTRMQSYGATDYGPRPDRNRMTWSNERSIISSIYTRLTVDIAAVDVRHVRMDEDNRYLEDIDSGINNCLTIEANIDQAARHFGKTLR